MHLYDPTVGFLGSNGVVPPGILIAAGAALSAQVRNSGQVSVAFFGDGAVNNGAFHEGLNLAANWDLPVIFVCENNLYATEMQFDQATKNTNVASRAAAYNIPGIQVDGNNVVEVYEKSWRSYSPCPTRRRAHPAGVPNLPLVWAPRRRSRNHLSNQRRSRGAGRRTIRFSACGTRR